MDKCFYCGSCIDSEHDSYYKCNCRSGEFLVCESCRDKNQKCPECGSRLIYHEESITKSAYFDPSTRDRLDL